MTKNLKMFLLFIIPILLIIISIPINRKAFALFFGGEGWVLLLLAIAVGAILVFLSHTIGYLIKVRSNGSHYIISLSSITVISIIYLLALMRQKLADVEQATGTFDLIAKGANIQEGFFTLLGTEGLISFTLNIAIVITAIVSYYLLAKKV